MYYRIAVNLLFLIIQIYIYQFISDIIAAAATTSVQSITPSWKLLQTKLIANILIILSIINLFIPLTQCAYKLPIIGGSIGIIYLLFITSELCLLHNITHDTAVCTPRKICINNYIYSIFRHSSYIYCIIAGIIITCAVIA
jgi:hypothetical protein